MHGPIQNYCQLVNSMLADVTGTKTQAPKGVLVAGSKGFGSPSAFWSAAAGCISDGNVDSADPDCQMSSNVPSCRHPGDDQVLGGPGKGVVNGGAGTDSTPANGGCETIVGIP